MAAPAHRTTVARLAPGAMEDGTAVPLDLARRRLVAALQGALGRGGVIAVPLASELTGIPERSLVAYRAGECMPGLANLLALCGLLGPAFTDSLLELVGLGGTRRLDNAAAPAPAQLLSHMAGEVALLAAALEDGHLDHVECAETARRLPELISALEAFRAGLAAA